MKCGSWSVYEGLIQLLGSVHLSGNRGITGAGNITSAPNLACVGIVSVAVNAALS